MNHASAINQELVALNTSNAHNLRFRSIHVGLSLRQRSLGAVRLTLLDGGTTLLALLNP